jgi:recombination protein RecR
MRTLPEPVQNLIDAFSRLPGIGPKTASRLTFYLLRAPEELARSLAQALTGIKQDTGLCEVCYNITHKEHPICEICSSDQRDRHILCVVEEPLDVLAIEKTAGFNGLYHVLHGVLSPIEGIGPEDLKIQELITRLQAGHFAEVILATNPTVEGEATAHYIAQILVGKGLVASRIAHGMPLGGELEMVDGGTLAHAIAGRRPMGF